MRQISTGKTKNKMKLVAAPRKNPYHEEQYYEDKLLLSNTIKEGKTDSTSKMRGTISPLKFNKITLNPWRSSSSLPHLIGN
jgi:hypothetical protein